MKCAAMVLFVCVSATYSHAQTVLRNITSAQLQAVLDLPLGQAVKLRDTYKVPLRAALARQVALAGKDCQAVQGQQNYNICMGHADEQADNDSAVFAVDGVYVPPIATTLKSCQAPTARIFLNQKQIKLPINPRSRSSLKEDESSRTKEGSTWLHSQKAQVVCYQDLASNIFRIKIIQSEFLLTY